MLVVQEGGSVNSKVVDVVQRAGRNVEKPDQPPRRIITLLKPLVKRELTDVFWNEDLQTENLGVHHGSHKSSMFLQLRETGDVVCILAWP